MNIWKMTEKMLAIGIDLGTTKLCVGIWQQDKVDILDTELGNKTMQNYISFSGSEQIVGDLAKQNSIMNPMNTIFNIKRLIGRCYNDADVTADIQHWPFSVVEDAGNIKVGVDFKGRNKLFTPEEITAIILNKIKVMAENHLKQPIEGAVITVPAYFTDSQRQATKTAGALAGFKASRIINESTAAAMAIGIQKQLTGEKNILVFDLGGGSLDVSVVNITGGSIFKVKSTAGDSHLGGEDFDNRIFEYILKEFKSKHKKDPTISPLSLGKLHAVAELIKKALSSSTKVCVEIDSFFEGINLNTSITRNLFEILCADLFSKIMQSVENVLSNVQLDKSCIHDVVLIGGSTNIPKIQNMLNEYFKSESSNFSTVPFEAVAYGAAIQAAVLNGDESPLLSKIQLVEITPLSLGIETSGNVMTTMIKRNSRIPCKHSQVFSTYTDDQLAVTIQVFEGERPMSHDNILLGTFDLIGIPPACRGVPQIEVTFDLNSDRILNVTAKDNNSGNTQSIVITKCSSGRFQAVDKMMDDVLKHEKEDEMKRRRIEARNHLERYIFYMRETIDDNNNKLSERDKNIIAKKCDQCLKWLERNVNIPEEDLEYQLIDLQLDCTQLILKRQSCDTKEHSTIVE